MKKKKLNAYLIGSLRMGGAESAVQNIISGLSKEVKEHVVLVLISHKEGLDYHKKNLGVDVYNLNSRNAFEAVVKLYYLVRKLGIVSIHAHLVQSIILAGLVSMVSPLNLIAYIHTMGRWKISPNLKGKVLICLERYFCNSRSKLVVYVSEKIQSQHVDTLRYSNSNSVVIPNPLFGDAPISKHDQESIKIITVCRLEPVKGFDWVMNSSWFDDYFSGVEWTIVGDGSLYSKLDQEISKSKNLKIALTGARSDVPMLLAQHNVFMLTSYTEGLSVALIEAMRAGLPIVCTDVGSNSEIVKHGENGFLIRVGDESGLKSALQKLENPAIRKKMGEKSLWLYKQKFDAEKIRSKLEELIA